MRDSRQAVAAVSVPDADSLRARETDPRTGLQSADVVERSLATWFSTNRPGRRCSLVKFEIDGIERHARGRPRQDLELALFIVGLVLKGHARRNDLIGSGPDGRFIVLLPGAGVRRAVSFSKRVCWDVSSQFGDDGRPITVSAGVASQDGPITHHGQLLESADSALRAAKWQGGNRVAAGSVEGQASRLPQRSWVETMRSVRSA